MRALSSADSAAGTIAREVAALAERVRVPRTVGEDDTTPAARARCRRIPPGTARWPRRSSAGPRSPAPAAAARRPARAAAAAPRRSRRAAPAGSSLGRRHRRGPRTGGRADTARPSEFSPTRATPRVDLRGDRRLIVGFLDAEAAPEQVDERVERHGPAERQAVPLVPVRRRPESAAAARASRRDLPMPASPTTNTTWPCPARARSKASSSRPSSRSRPTNGVSPRSA